MLSFKRAPLTCTRKKPLYRTLVRATPPDVLYEYVDAYTKYICATDLASCAPKMIVPPVEEQLRIVQGLYDVKSKVDTYGLDGVFMKLIMVKDDATVGNLMSTLEIYDHCVKLIRLVVSYAQKIPIEFGDNEM